MKRLTLFMCLGLAAVALSCSKGMGLSPEDDVVELTVSAGTSQTRAMNTTFEDKVTSLQVFLFSYNGALESVGYSESDKVTLRCFRGDKNILAIVNHDEIEWTTETTVSELRGTVVKLADEKWNVMVGSSRIRVVKDIPGDSSDSPIVELSDGEEDSSYESVDATITGASGSITIEVSRVVARIVLRTVKNGTAENTESPVTVHCAYITNVVGDADLTATTSDCTYVPKVWYNKCGNQGDLEDLLFGGNVERTLKNDGDALPFSQYFYCYPNPTETDDNMMYMEDKDDESFARFTRLVVEAKYDDLDSYYPVSIGGIQSNHSYEVTLVITGLGAINPEGQAWGENETGEGGGSTNGNDPPLSRNGDGDGDIFTVQGGYALINEY